MTKQTTELKTLNSIQNQNTQENLQQEGINTQNEDNRQTQKKITGESKNKNDGVQLSTRYQQYSFAKFYLRGTSRPQVFPIFGTESKNIKVDSILTAPVWEKRHEQIRRVHSISGISPTIPSAPGGGVMTKILQHSRDATGKKIKYNERDVAGTVKTPSGNQQNFVKRMSEVRRLTPIECERLQGFPDQWTKYGHDGKEISDTQRYKMMGNAVTTNVISAIISKMI